MLTVLTLNHDNIEVWARVRYLVRDEVWGQFYNPYFQGVEDGVRRQVENQVWGRIHWKIQDAIAESV